MPQPVSRSALPGRKPVVLVPACLKTVGDHATYCVGRKYIDAVELAGGLPWVVTGADPADLPELLDHADGVLLTGSPSNVDPSHYGQALHDAHQPLDPLRDRWTLPLVRLALDRGVPLMGICRGLQEINVALGGSLLQAVQETPGRNDHRAPQDVPLEVEYGPAHPVHIQPGGLLEQLLEQREIQVNSIHMQGVDRLAPGLRAEALAPDGLVEAFSLPEASHFLLAVQWHPEWHAADNPHSQRMLSGFGAACRRRQLERASP